MSLRERSVLQAPLKIGCLFGLLVLTPLLCADEKKPPPAAAEPSSLNDSLAPNDSVNSSEQEAPPKAAELPTGIGESLVGTSATDTLEQIANELQAAEVTSAKAQLSAYIEQIEDASHRYSPDLIAPLVLLGDAQMIEKDYGAAVESFDRAIHIDRVANGLHSPSQSAIMYKEADALTAMGDLASANDREMYAFEVQERLHEPDSMDLLPAAMRLADWHMKTSSVLAARGMFEQAAQILEANEALQGDAAIRALRGIANTYRMERFPPLFSSPDRDPNEDGFAPGPASQDPFGRRQQQEFVINNFGQGEKALHRVTTMVLGDPASSVNDKAAALIDLADWYLLFDHRERAEPLYVEALQMLEEAGLDADATRLATPEMLYFPLPPPLPLPPIDKRESPEAGHVTVSYTVTQSGEVHDLATVETVPNDLMEFRVRRSMREARFRPALQDGKLIASAPQSYTYEYQYFPKTASNEPLETAPAKQTSNERGTQKRERRKASTPADDPSGDEKEAGKTPEPEAKDSARLDVTPYPSNTRMDG